MTNQEEQKIRETIDSLLPMKELDTYLKETAHNIISSSYVALAIIQLLLNEAAGLVIINTPKNIVWRLLLVYFLSNRFFCS